jgi:predicted AAA+ superfamily ATPase
LKRSQLEQIIRDNIARPFLSVRQRAQKLPVDIDRVITLTGARRTGKTSLFFRMIRELRQQVSVEHILYLNFEDDRLFGCSLEDLDTILDAYFSLYPSAQNEMVYFFFDEIQGIRGWESFVRRIKDTLPARVYVTGSSASLLGREIATALRGRTLTFEVFPLQFKEYLLWQEKPIRAGTSKENQQIQHAFQKYLSTTAFPELINWQEERQIMALQEYIDLIIYRDVAERLQLTNTHTLKYLIHYLLVNAGNPLSVNAVFKDMKGRGLRISKDSLYEYMDLLEDVYAIFMVPIFSRNLKVQQRNPKKLYMLDHGLKKSVSIGTDQGALLENIIFLDLRRRHANLYYWQDIQEVDFIVSTTTGLEAINVCLKLDQPATLNRETRGLLNCLSALKLNRGWLVSGYKEDLIEKDGKTIHIIPAWKWLLAPPF